MTHLITKQKSFIVSLLILALAWVANPALNYGQTLEEKPQSIKEEKTTIVQDGDLMLVVKEKEFERVRHMLDYLLQNARDHAVNDQMDIASEELMMAASYMYVDVSSAESSHGDAVRKAAEGLEEVAGALTYSETPLDIVDRAIFNAHHKLAAFHQLRAETNLEAGFHKTSGYALQAALVHYKHAAFTEARLDDVALTSIVDNDLFESLEKFAIAMQEGKDIVSYDADALLEELELEIRNLEIAKS